MAITFSVTLGRQRNLVCRDCENGVTEVPLKRVTVDAGIAAPCVPPGLRTYV